MTASDGVRPLAPELLLPFLDEMSKHANWCRKNTSSVANCTCPAEAAAYQAAQIRSRLADCETSASLRARLEECERERANLERAISDALRCADTYAVRHIDGHLDGSPATPNLSNSITGTVHRLMICLAAGLMDRQALEKDRDSLKQRVERMSDVLALDEPWPLHDVLDKLRAATVHLLDVHACDTHGHEEYKAAMMQAETIITRIVAALKET